MEECAKLIESRNGVGGLGRHVRSRKKEKGDVGVEKVTDKEEGEKAEKLTSSFGTIYEFLCSFCFCLC